jgi:hypothetical protein
MGDHWSSAGLGLALLLGLWPGAPPPRAQAQGATPRPLPFKSVHGTLEAVDRSLNGLIMKTDEGRRVAWKFDKAVIAQLSGFKRGDPIVVIYRQRESAKVVTAVAFPGAADAPVYVNTTGQRVELVSGPMANGACGPSSDQPLNTSTIPMGGRAEIADACWCCAPAGESCTPANKSGAGQAFLTHCFN